MARVEYTSVGQYEKEYNFENAVADVNVMQGAWGTITNGKFVPGNGTYAVMQVEVGDEAGCEDYVIPAGADLRLLDTTKVGQVTGNKLIRLVGTIPANVSVGDKVKVDGNAVISKTSSGTLTVTRVMQGALEVSLPTA